MLETIKCKRCGKQISSLIRPVHTSTSTMNKYKGICSNCITQKEFAQMMFDMNKDISRKAGY